jgi:hypothetical protein
VSKKILNEPRVYTKTSQPTSNKDKNTGNGQIYFGMDFYRIYPSIVANKSGINYVKSGFGGSVFLEHSPQKWGEANFLGINLGFFNQEKCQ